MNEDRSTDKSSGKRKENRDTPAPERGSPVPENNVDAKEAHRRIESESDEDANPLAPPVNTQAGS